MTEAGSSWSLRPGALLPPSVESEKDKASVLASPTSSLSLSRVVGWTIVAAFTFALGIIKSGIVAPQTIVDQFQLRSFRMAKGFVTAIATSICIKLVLSMVPATRGVMRRSRGFIFSKPHGLVGAVVGSLIQGIGMRFSFGCPGTIFTQVGSMVPGAIFALAGAVIGTVCFGFVKSRIMRYAKVGCWVANKATLDLAYDFQGSYQVLSLAVLGVLVAILAGLEDVSPEELPGVGIVSEVTCGGGLWVVICTIPYLGSVLARQWSPYIGGIVLGMSQLFLILGVHIEMGATGAFSTILTWILKVVGRVTRKKVWRSGSVLGMGDISRGVFGLGAMLFAIVISSLDGTRGQYVGFAPILHFLGGFLLSVGAMSSGGCASSQGVSGISGLSVRSLIAVPMMFAGGFAGEFASQLL